MVVWEVMPVPVGLWLFYQLICRFINQLGQYSNGVRRINFDPLLQCFPSGFCDHEANNVYRLVWFSPWELELAAVINHT